MARSFVGSLMEIAAELDVLWSRAGFNGCLEERNISIFNALM